MPRHEPIRLRESPDAAPAHAPVIDAQFKVVGRRRRWFGRVVMWACAFALAGLVGFLIPPALMVLREVAALVG